MGQTGLLAILVIVLATAMVASARSVYDVLDEFGLPIGLLPPTVTSYELSPEGEFVVHLAEPTYCKFEDQVYYEKKITGKLSSGAIRNLQGIKAKQAFLWLPVTAIRVDPPSIYFEVGVLSKKLSLSLFEKTPSCNSGGKAPRNFDTSVMNWLDEAVASNVEAQQQARHRKFAQAI